MSDLFDDYEAELDAISALFSGISDDQWASPSLCPGWSCSDVLLHLAQTESGVEVSIQGGAGLQMPVSGAATIDEAMEQWVAAERGQAPSEILKRWEDARRASVAALRQADPGQLLAWAAAPLKPMTLATTRLSEHWIHAHDIADPLGIRYPDTDRLYNLARLAHRTIPYAFAKAGRDDPPSVRAELAAPGGSTWTFGDEGADVVITGPAGEFVRVAARRLTPAEATNLKATGPKGSDVLALIRTYA
jgi:uncharacterized protein (TIGR03084 family)